MLRKKISLFLSFFTFFQLSFSFCCSALSARAVVCMLSGTGEVIYSLNENERLSMASTTKIMTCLLAVESGRMNETVTITKAMTAIEGTSMGLRSGDRLTLGNVVSGMMLLSGNDAAITTALFLCGSEEAFAKKMNEKAKEIGMKNTHFVTASGLDDDEHYSTACDMALLSAYAMKNPEFRSLVQNQYGTVTYIKPKASYKYRNHNRFLSMYEGACGIKTGFTKKSGRCLVTAVKTGSDYMITVTLNAPDDWNDHIYLYNTYLPLVKDTEIKDDFTAKVNVVGGTENFVTASIKSKITVSNFGKKQITTKVFLPSFVYAPVEKGEKVGFVRYYYGEICIGEEYMTADSNISFKKTEKKKNIMYYINRLLGKRL